MNDDESEQADLNQGVLRLIKEQHSRIRAIEDALKQLGIPQSFLTERYNEHLLNRQVRDEKILGPADAARIWRDEDGQSPSHDVLPE